MAYRSDVITSKAHMNAMNDQIDTLNEDVALAEWKLTLIEQVFFPTMSETVRAHFERFKIQYLDHTKVKTIAKA
jgi:hypothetical protein